MEGVCVGDAGLLHTCISCMRMRHAANKQRQEAAPLTALRPRQPLERLLGLGLRHAAVLHEVLGEGEAVDRRHRGRLRKTTAAAPRATTAATAAASAAPRGARCLPSPVALSLSRWHCVAWLRWPSPLAAVCWVCSR
jgi:hypothetical protein